MNHQFVSVLTRPGSTKARFLVLPETKLPQNLKPLSHTGALDSWTRLARSFTSICSTGYTAAYRVQSVGLTGHRGIRDGVYDMDIFKVYTNLLPSDTFKAKDHPRKRRAVTVWFWYLINLCGALGLSIELNGLWFGGGFSVDDMDISAGYGPFRFSERVKSILESLEMTPNTFSFQR